MGNRPIHPRLTQLAAGTREVAASLLTQAHWEAAFFMSLLAWAKWEQHLFAKSPLTQQMAPRPWRQRVGVKTQLPGGVGELELRILGKIQTVRILGIKVFLVRVGRRGIGRLEKDRIRIDGEEKEQSGNDKHNEEMDPNAATVAEACCGGAGDRTSCIYGMATSGLEKHNTEV
ncbi:hypothetical protein PIB30_030189 [Stylosanthes scabra]|uniref:Uncharacterized protein n=1 Tax=Stylosanthes scabra TaxID=79078 RepID=A0ABU6TC74_9FABA|nr:hypothetical protein [Stylosanthes scabra]